MPRESKVVEVSMLASRESQPVELSSIESVFRWTLG